MLTWQASLKKQQQKEQTNKQKTGGTVEHPPPIRDGKNAEVKKET